MGKVTVTVDGVDLDELPAMEAALSLVGVVLVDHVLSLDDQTYLCEHRFSGSLVCQSHAIWRRRPDGLDWGSADRVDYACTRHVQDLVDP